jgi:hypothetical protein
MNETLLQLARIRELMFWGLVFMAVLDFMGLMVAAWTFHVVRRVSLGGDKLGEILARMDERSERVGFYLFSKLGPTDVS